MKILAGLFDQMVLQMTKRQVCDAEFSGQCNGSGTVLARVVKSGRAVKDFNWIKVGKATGKKFAARLKGLAAGGPYDISLQVQDKAGQVIDTAEVSDVLVGEVWILAGQSNMEGIGFIKDGETPDPMVRAFQMNDQWAVAKDPIHNLSIAVADVHADIHGGILPQRDKRIGVGPGVAYGKEMYRQTGIPQGLICCAHGGTSMAQWNPALKKQGDKSLYGAMVNRFLKNGGKVSGVLWYQGCSDTNVDAVKIYTANMKKLVKSMRRDFGDQKLPVTIVQISRVANTVSIPEYWNAIRDQQRKLEQVIDNLSCVPAIDLELDDAIHISGSDQSRLGRRLVYAMQVQRNGLKAGKKPIALKNVRFERNKQNQMTIVVEFDNVVGELQAEGRPTGFVIAEAEKDDNAIYHVELKKNCAILCIRYGDEELMEKSLYYGFGLNPYCNITDQADRSLPAFGPVVLGTEVSEAITKLVRNISTTEILESAGKLESLECPDVNSLKLHPFTADGVFCHRHPEFVVHGKDGLIYYVGNLECSEDMKVGVRLGYDGPVKMWIDGKEVFHDPNGTNPAMIDATTVDLAASKGTHQIVVALGTNNGAAWGIFLRFHRKDVTKARMKKGPEFYAMPEFKPL